MDRQLAIAKFDEAADEARAAHERGDLGAAAVAEQQLEALTVEAWRGMGTED
ncbi:MAG TPA: hypothetical protein VGH57_16465 [Amycolatopsis sp.]|jgi:hypothetical protein